MATSGHEYVSPVTRGILWSSAKNLSLCRAKPRHRRRHATGYETAIEKALVFHTWWSIMLPLAWELDKAQRLHNYNVIWRTINNKK